MGIKYVLLLLLLSGCMTQTRIDRALSKCPQLVQNRVGDFRVGLFSMAFGDGTATIGFWDNEHGVWHEAGHIAYYFIPPPDEYIKEFKEAAGFISWYAQFNNIEEQFAEAFTEGMKGRSNPKIEMAMKFFDGEF